MKRISKKLVDKSTDAFVLSIEIFNNLGQIIYRQNIELCTDIVVDFQYPKGLYLIRLLNNKKILKRKKVVK